MTKNAEIIVHHCLITNKFIVRKAVNTTKYLPKSAISKTVVDDLIRMGTKVTIVDGKR